MFSVEISFISLFCVLFYFQTVTSLQNVCTTSPARTVPQQALSAITGTVTGGYCTAPGGIRPDVPLSDVPGYQPWKALNEFAMHNDLEQPPFQQLVSATF